MTSAPVSRLAGVAAALGVAALTTLSIVRVTRPPAPVPATAPDSVFSAERAMRHVEQIAVRPHPMGTPDHDRVRDYIVGQLSALGLKAQLQATTAIGTRYQDAGRVQNIVAWMPGTDPTAKAVLLVAHYDGVEAGPAAADDGAGCAAMLETLRALRTRRQPLAHDVIALFTDGEEAGLLGSAAFVREHPWARDVNVVLNFEARGTTGRSYMFETGAGNLDVVETLRRVPEVTAGSVFTTVYRALPNDTDLSELMVLGTPALNFAFADGVERYHTSRDDVAHLSPGSLQHHGVQMLALARAFATEPLPRPKTGDAVFFDLPLIGLVVYPEWMAIPLVVIALVLTVIVVMRYRRGLVAGVLGMIVATVICAGAARSINPTGPARWSGFTAAALALFVLAINAACYSAVAFMLERWKAGKLEGSSVRAFERSSAPALVVWLVLAVVTSLRAPGVSYLFVWPLLFALAAELSRSTVARWIAAALTILMLAGLTYTVAVVMLGVATAGAATFAIFTSLTVWLLAPVLAPIAQGARWTGAPWLAGAALVVAVLTAFLVRPSPDHPIRSSLVYAENADERDAWLGAQSGMSGDAWTRSVIGAPAAVPDWTRRLFEFGGRYLARPVPRVGLEPPRAIFIRDTIISGARRVVMRVKAPRGTTGLLMHAFGAPVSRTAIDGRVVDTTRYRIHTPVWTMEYWAVPDSGFIAALSIPIGQRIDVELAARRPGIPVIPGVTIPPRPPYVVPSQSGDVSIIYTRVVF